MPDVLILGAGISGLAAGYRLMQAGYSVRVLEALERPGGVIHSIRKEGYLLEEGPHTLMPRSALLLRMIEELGLQGRKIEASVHARNRFIVRRGVPVPLPLSLLAFLRSPVLSLAAKVRLLLEPFQPRSHAEDEPLSDFITRRLGREVLDYLVEPFVAGIYAGDPDRLSTRYAFPVLYELEREGGSLFRGMLRRRKSSPRSSPGGRMFSFPEGLQELPQAFARRLGEVLWLECTVREVIPLATGWQVQAEKEGQVEHLEAPAIISTLPVYRAQQVFSFELPDVIYAPVALVSLGFARKQVAHPLDGFGMLIPRREPFRLLGVLFPSSLFPGRAPEGRVLLTCFLGGMRHPEDVHRSDEELLALVQQELHVLLGVSGEPEMVHIVRHARAIPQYELGYGTFLMQLEKVEHGYPGLFFAGNYRSGISVHQAMESGWKAAKRFMESGVISSA